MPASEELTLKLVRQLKYRSQDYKMEFGSMRKESSSVMGWHLGGNTTASSLARVREICHVNGKPGRFYGACSTRTGKTQEAGF